MGTRSIYENVLIFVIKALEQFALAFFSYMIERKSRLVALLNFETVMKQLESLGKERTKKIYMSNGAKEPVFGVTIGSMKQSSSKLKSISLWPKSFMQQGITMRCILRESLQIPKQ